MKDCKEGYHWCPIKKECVKTDNKKQGKGQQFGQGMGPIGIPKKKIIEGLNKLFESPAASDAIKSMLAKDRDKWKDDKARLTAGSDTSRMVSAGFRQWKDGLVKRK